MKVKMLKKPQLDDCIPKCVWMKNLIGNKYYLLMFEIVIYRYFKINIFLVSCTTLNGKKSLER